MLGGEVSLSTARLKKIDPSRDPRGPGKGLLPGVVADEEDDSEA